MGKWEERETRFTRVPESCDLIYYSGYGELRIPLMQASAMQKLCTTCVIGLFGAPYQRM
jgi:hypothetical protein